MAHETDTWRDWFPWPLGTHWCWFETVLAWILVGNFAMFVLLMLYALVG